MVDRDFYEWETQIFFDDAFELGDNDEEQQARSPTVILLNVVAPGTCGLCYKSFTIVIYDRNDSMIIIYDRNESMIIIYDRNDSMIIIYNRNDSMIIIYDRNDSMIIMYDRNDSSQNYKTINCDSRVVIYNPNLC